MNRMEEYQALRATAEQPAAGLEDTLTRARKRLRRRRAMVLRPLTGLAACFAVFVVLVNFCAPVAYACSKVPGLRELAEAVTFSRSLTDAVNNEYVQPIDLKQTQNGITASVEYLIVDQKQVNVFYRLDSKKYESLPFAHLNLTGFDGDHLMEKFNSPKWKKLSMACLGCGSCTFACPTCQCYDIRDYDAGNGIQRYRCWDSCMYSDFTLMAHGTNRPTQLERYRQRFMHKLVYFPSNNDGMYSCVGCGRCIEKCPMNLNIVKVIKALGEDAK